MSSRHTHPGPAMALAAACALLAGCAAPVVTRFHTLMPAPTALTADAPLPSAGPVAEIWEVLPVSVPVQVDQPPWVVRLPDDSLAVLEHERWIAPLADELRAALAEQLRQTLPPAAMGVAAAAPRWRVAVDVLRFESLPGRLARLDAQWLLRSSQGSTALRCQASLSQAAPGGYTALAAAHRAAVAQLGLTIAAALVALERGDSPTCLRSQPAN